MTVAADERWLIALDIDGTLLSHRGEVKPEIIEAVRRVDALGHEVMLATGRSMDDTLPVLRLLDINPEYVVCSNGAIVWKRDPTASVGYREEYVETFDASAALKTIRDYLPEGKYAIEDANGDYWFTEPFPGIQTLHATHQVEFDELLGRQATRVVVISPSHDTEQFLAVVEKMGLHRVTYAIGLTAWLDISPEGVNKSTGLEKVREHLDIPRSRIFAAGDGRNDIDMLQWAASMGRGVAMADAVPEVLEAGNEVCASVHDNGIAQALASF